MPIARVALVENLPDGILVLNNEDRVVDMNPAAAKDGSELENANREKVGQFLGPIANTDYRLETRPADRINGRKRRPADLFRGQHHPTPDKKNIQVGGLIVLRDVTERKKIELKMRESERRY